MNDAEIYHADVGAEATERISTLEAEVGRLKVDLSDANDYRHAWTLVVSDTLARIRTLEVALRKIRDAPDRMAASVGMRSIARAALAEPPHGNPKPQVPRLSGYQHG